MSKPTYAELREQIRKLELEAEAVRLEEIKEAKARIQEIIASTGLSAEDVLGTVKNKDEKKPKGPKTVRPIKYRDPKSGLGWTGRGPQPKWFKDLVDGGTTREDLEVKDNS